MKYKKLQNIIAFLTKSEIPKRLFFFKSAPCRQARIEPPACGRGRKVLGQIVACLPR